MRGQQNVVWRTCTRLLEEGFRGGIALWRHASPAGAPSKAVTRSRYLGLNRFALTLAMAKFGFQDPRFVSHPICAERDWTVAEHAPASHTYFVRCSAAGQCTQVRRLYNAADVQGVPERTPTVLERAGALIDQLITNARPELGHSAMVVIPHYDMASDSIRMPPRDRFASGEDYHAALLHELVHWSGEASREGRFAARHGFEDRATEELRAEIATVYLLQELGLHLSARHHKEHDRYLGIWSDMLRQDPKKFLRCAVHAERIADYVLALDPSLARKLGRPGVVRVRKRSRLQVRARLAGEALAGPDLEVIAPRTNYAEYVGPMMGRAQGFSFQRVNDRYVVAHRLKVPGALARSVAVGYDDGHARLPSTVPEFSRAATQREVDTLRRGVTGLHPAAAWSAAFTRHNQYFGKMEHVDDEFALQRVRPGHLVVHRVSGLRTKCEQGKSYRIRYKDGVGSVAPMKDPTADHCVVHGRAG